MNSDLFYPIILSVAVAVLVSLLGYLIVRAIQQTQDIDYDDQLEELLSDDDELENEDQPSPMEKWNEYWSRVFSEGGIEKYDDEPDRAGRDVIFIGLLVAVIMSTLTRNIVVGPVIAILLILATAFVLRARSGRKHKEINNQLPGFLFALKANIQASETNERAMLKVIDGMPSPLYDDLIVVKNRLMANTSFKEALEALSEKTKSRDLKFLAACMIQATDSGSNLEDQLNSIQDVLKSRRQVDDEINKATKAAMPAMWLTSFVIPALFIFSYLFDYNAQSFWFKEPLSWVAIAVTLMLYGAGMFFVRKAITKIKEL